MGYVIKGNTIRLTRGDTLLVQLELTKNGEEYIPQAGDEIRFALKHKIMKSDGSDYEDDAPLVYKVIPNDTLVLRIDSTDTKELPFGDYVYDLQITYGDGIVDTFITNSSFILTPEVD